jgi:anti-sigma factor RsiW
MSCQRELQINAYLDGELDLSSALELEDHVATCAECARLLAARRALQQAIGAADLRFHPTPIQARRLQRAVRPPRFGRLIEPHRLRMLAALVLVAVGSWMVGRRWSAIVPGAAPPTVTAAAAALSGAAGGQPPQVTPIAEQVVAGHVRALLSGRASDVASSDRHTVKPWYTGRLDYSPPVVDLAAAGFPLLGGRLDYVGGHPVAALVYQAGHHTVSVFIWPAGSAAGDTVAPGGMPVATSLRGFQLLRWTQAGMVFWATSDATADSLSQLARALAAALPR